MFSRYCRVRTQRTLEYAIRTLGEISMYRSILFAGTESKVVFDNRYVDKNNGYREEIANKLQHQNQEIIYSKVC